MAQGNEPSNICNIFNSHFASLTKDIGMEGPINDDDTMQSIIETYQSQPSIKGIMSHLRVNHVSTFDIMPVSEHTVLKEISKLNERKSTGCDLMPPKIVKMCQAPVPLSIFRSNSKFDENSERCSFEYTRPITTIFCTRHDSDTVVTCAKYRCDGPRIFYTRVF